MKRHDSMRGWMAYELYQQMLKNKDIWLITCDLGFKMWDDIMRDFPDRAINVGAAEVSGTGIAVGLALEGKIPFVYSITTFLLRRPYETIHLYVNNEKIPVRLIGGGRDKDYTHDGASHWSEDAHHILKGFSNIYERWPETKEEIPAIVTEMVETTHPMFLSLKR